MSTLSPTGNGYTLGNTGMPERASDLVDPQGRPLGQGPWAPDGRPVLLGPDGKTPITDSKGFLLPPYRSFSAIYQSFQRMYRWTWDECLRQQPDYALAMRRDPYLMALLDERKRAIAQTAWHLEPDDAKSQEQKDVADALTKIVQATPHLNSMLKCLLNYLWYGRYGIQLVYAWQKAYQQKQMQVVDWSPVNGDKIQHGWDGTPAIAMSAAYAKDYWSETVATDRFRALWLRVPEWRERFIIGKHEPDDSDFFAGEMAGALHGTGIRSRIYWMDWLKKELQSWVVDYMERVGTGLTVLYYQQGNAQAQKQAEKTAKEWSRNSVIAWPALAGVDGKTVGDSIQRIEVSTTGAEFLLSIVKYFDEKIERFIIGQSGSSRSETTGLGTHDTDFMASTKFEVIHDGCLDLQDTLTSDFVKPLKRWNFPSAEFGLRWVFDLEKPNPDKQIEAVVKLNAAGVDFDKNQVRALSGMRKPEEGDDVLEGREAPDPSAMFGGGGSPFGKKPGENGAKPPGAPAFGGSNGQNGDHKPPEPSVGIKRMARLVEHARRYYKAREKV